MMSKRPVVTTLTVLALASVLALRPLPAMAGDCGADYVECLADSGALGTSDQLHETECYAEYWRCVERALRVY